MRKLDQSGVIHHLAVILFGLVIAAAVGFVGYRVWQQNQDIEAQAAGWTTIVGGSPQHPVLKACKTSSAVRLFASSPKGYSGTTYYGFYLERDKSLLSTTSLQVAPGKTATKTVGVNMHQYPTYSTSAGDGTKGGGGPFAEMKAVSKLASC